MAKKKKEIVVLENVELKPQIIGYTYKKKSNIGRVFFIFIAFALVVYYINDISVFINDLFGKETAVSIDNLAGNTNKNENKNDFVENKIEYHLYSNELKIIEKDLIINNFNLNNNILKFDIINNTDKKINLTGKKYFLEIYNDSKTLLERHKIDILSFDPSEKESFELKITNEIYYLVFEEKTTKDYPVVNLDKDANGNALFTCNKENDSIIYKFNNDKLINIKHTVSESFIDDTLYYKRYNDYQSKATSYNNIDGISATFNGTLNGYSAVFDLNLEKINLEKINEKYYYSYKEVPKVIKFEMETYGFDCN